MPGFLRRADESIAVDGRDIPLLGGETSVVEALELVGADTVAVTATEHLGSDGIRALAWDLESRDVDLVVAPSIVDVVGAAPVDAAGGRSAFDTRRAPEISWCATLCEIFVRRNFRVIDTGSNCTCSPGRGSGGQVLEPGPGVVSSGTNGAGRQTIPDAQVPFRWSRTQTRRWHR